MFKPDKKSTALIVMDMQEKLVDTMNEEMFETVLHNTKTLTKTFALMGVPLIETLQYPQGLGQRTDDLADMPNPALVIEKQTFSACGDNKLIEFLKEKDIKTVVLAGLEAHVCILLTALDLLEAGYHVHIPADAVISVNDFNWETGLDMAQKAGAVVTVTETIVYQLLGSSQAPEFKAVHKFLK